MSSFLAALSHHGYNNESSLFVGILSDVLIHLSLNSCLFHAHTCKYKTLALGYRNIDSSNTGQGVFPVSLGSQKVVARL